MKQRDILRCKNCRHIIYYDEIEDTYRHKHMLHNDNCECRKPEPNWISIQKEIEKNIDEAMKDYKPPRYDRSRGFDSLSFEEKFRPFTI